MGLTKEDWELNRQHGLAEVDGFMETFSPGNFWKADKEIPSWLRIDVETHSAMGKYVEHVNSSNTACLGAQFAFCTIASFHMTKMDSWNWTEKERKSPKVFQVKWHESLIDGLMHHRKQIEEDTFENFMDSIEDYPEVQKQIEEQVNAIKAKKH